MTRSTQSEYQPAPPGLRLRTAPRKSPVVRIRFGSKANCGGVNPCKVSNSF